MPRDPGDDVGLERFAALTELLVLLEHHAKHADGCRVSPAVS
jgi:hypothetical protein